MKDDLFKDPGRRQGSFDFDDAVVAVFDDMLKRSVPFYFEIQNMIADLGEQLLPDKAKVYDLGCSTGTTIALLSKRISKKEVEYVAVDNSAPMLEKAQLRLQDCNIDSYSLVNADINSGIEISNADMVVMNLLLQFIDVDKRPSVLQDIYNGLNDNGVLVFVEKVANEQSKLDEIYIESYHEFKKRNLYTDEEIARKRAALENFLIPLSVEQNLDYLSAAGFSNAEIFFRWFNFVGILAIK